MRPGLLVFGLCCALAGCASTGAVPAPFPRPGNHPAAGTPAPVGSEPPATADGSSYAIVGTALALRGAPYRNGGADPSGFDCSGFVEYVFEQHGVRVPRNVTEQYRQGRPVPDDQLQPGDLVFFSTVASGASHVGIAIGGDEFVHAPSSHGEVRVEHLSAPYWSTRYLGARRMTSG